MSHPPSKRRRITAAVITPAKKKLLTSTPRTPACLGLPEPDLLHQRAESQHKLKSAWESIFAKYDKDTSDFADEIDLATGEIVVDKGHLRGLNGRAGTGIGADLWTDWIGAEEEGDEGGEESDIDTGQWKAAKQNVKALANGTQKQAPRVDAQKGPSKGKMPKMLLVGNTVYGITDCGLCAEQDELDLTPCSHADHSTTLDEKENTPNQSIPLSSHNPRTPASRKAISLLLTATTINPPNSIQNRVDDHDLEPDELSATSTTRPSGLTPAINSLIVASSNSTAISISKTFRAPPQKPSSHLPSSPITRHISRRPQIHPLPLTSASTHIPSSPPRPQSPKPTAVITPKNKGREREIWAPLPDDPLAEKTWHARHPEGSPPRPARLPIYPQCAERARLSPNEEDNEEPDVEGKLPPQPTPKSKKAPQKKQSAFVIQKKQVYPQISPPPQQLKLQTRKNAMKATLSTPASKPIPHKANYSVNTSIKTPQHQKAKSDSDPLLELWSSSFTRTPGKTLTPKPPAKSVSTSIAAKNSLSTNMKSRKRKREESSDSEHTAGYDSDNDNEGECGGSRGAGQGNKFKGNLGGIGLLEYITTVKTTTPPLSSEMRGKEVKLEKVRKRGVNVKTKDSDSGSGDDDGIVSGSGVNDEFTNGKIIKAVKKETTKTVVAKVWIKKGQRVEKNEILETLPSTTSRSRRTSTSRGDSFVKTPIKEKLISLTSTKSPSSSSSILSLKRGELNVRCGTKGYSCRKAFCWACLDCEEEQSAAVGTRRGGVD